jgi:hypothetical protein
MLSWDWKEQPDLDRLARQIRLLSLGTVHLHQVDTDSDQFAIVLATTELDPAGVKDVYERLAYDDNAPDVLDLDLPREYR